MIALDSRRSGITAIEMFDYFVSTGGSRIAIKSQQGQFSYSELDACSRELASSMIAVGIRKGDRVAVLSLNNAYQLILLIACMRVGAIYVPVNFRLQGKELEYILNQSDSKLLFTEFSGFFDKVNELSLPGIQQCIYLDSQSFDDPDSICKFSGKGGDANIDFEYDPNAVAYQMYTSGTTGLPKGVLITQQQLAFFMVQVMLIPARANPGDVHLVVAPLYHAAALCSALLGLCTGRTLVLMREFDPGALIESLVSEKAHDVVLVPAMLQACLQRVSDLSQYDFSHLKKILYGGSPITVPVLKEAMEVFNCEFQQCFGMTEMVASATFLTVEDHRVALEERTDLLKSAGKAGPFVELKIVDPESGRELPQGESGEVCVKAPYVMLGYSKNSKATDEVLRDGWYHTGDGGYLDEEGYLFLNDRIKDMIISGGENIYPIEVENVLMAHPNVMDVAVIGMPSDEYGEVGLAFCVLKDGVDSDAMSAELISHCRNCLAHYKAPKRYEFINELPRNASGKILKRELRLLL